MKQFRYNRISVTQLDITVSFWDKIKFYYNRVNHNRVGLRTKFIAIHRVDTLTHNSSI